MGNDCNTIRRQLEKSGEVLKENESMSIQNIGSEDTSKWDTLKEVPFRGNAESTEISECEEEELSM